jgi:Bac_Flav_CT_M: Bacteroides conjugative transposon TraM protein
MPWKAYTFREMPRRKPSKEAEAAGVSGTNTSISGGLDMGSQIVAGAANSVINATKSAASKNIRKIKVTIKTNYRILLKDAKK